ncbi:dTDP-4-dehydrorhamnose reductase [Thioalkalivibrio sp. XN8]|uniref:dTDP-4-dehydrorhamnose reductase n=1 Tax=Thioalkalivibrio sp. XN8 TaxID=2712863 RepID=UPI0013EC3B1A|nr:dTDP-4-dehydrorhamnose reductase [Thioalkalivibrio sp. XN8]NGP53720.1 dTDP-4-dehydrorhamnose reductase [Thioalkalivibrio sp. XN8]
MSIIVLGANGQLARHLLGTVPSAEFWGRETLDVADAEALEARLVEAAPRAIINAAAYTAVDRAESEPVEAWRVNVEAPAAAARAARRLDAALVHVSTDYVFDGSANTPYAEDAPTCPLGVYGASKLAGELAVRTICPRHWILRTSWVFSEYGHNFMKTVLRLAESGNPLRIVADQLGRPTYAGHLAELIAALDPAGDSPQLPYGTWHATGGEIASWHGFAQRIVARAAALGLLAEAPEVIPISTADYPAPARRPAYSVLAPSAAIAALDGTTFDWNTGLERALAALAGAAEAVTP